MTRLYLARTHIVGEVVIEYRLASINLWYREVEERGVELGRRDPTDVANRASKAKPGRVS